MSIHPNKRKSVVKTFRWEHWLHGQNFFAGFERVPQRYLVAQGQQHNIGEISTVTLLHFYISRHAGTQKKQKQKHMMKNMNITQMCYSLLGMVSGSRVQVLVNRSRA